MSEIQFQMIVKIITNGAPALAEELCNAIANVINENTAMRSELEAIKTAEGENTVKATETTE